MSDKPSFADIVTGSQTGGHKPHIVKNGEPEDDPARPAEYQAVRRIRTYTFYDIGFRRHDGSGQAFDRFRLETWLFDGLGECLTLLWPWGEVVLRGRHLDLLEEDLMRRIVAEFRQVPPAAASQVPAGKPVITTMQINMFSDNGMAA